MVNEKLNEQLYDKMMAELTHFRSELLAKPPEEILKNAEEYMVRSDIVMAVEEMELDEKRAAALLKSATPLADVYKKFSDLNVEHMDVIRNSIENTANEVLREEYKLRRAPLYKYPASHASEHGELDDYRVSHKANVACKKAIEDAIHDHYADNCLGRGAVKQVVDAFGYDRMFYVLANTIRQMNHDGRISNENKLWAATITVYPDMDGFQSDRNAYLVLNSHPGLIDIFVRQARREHLLSLPLTKEDIKAEAAKILSQFQNAKEPNSPNGTHFIAQVSPDFLSRAKDKDRDRMMDMLPFDSLSLCTLEGRKGIYATITSDENRFQKLRLRKPSIRAQLAVAKLNEHEKPAGKAKSREEAR